MLSIRTDNTDPQDLISWLTGHLQHACTNQDLFQDIIYLLAITLYAIWYLRNRAQFHAQKLEVLQALQLIEEK